MLLAQKAIAQHRFTLYNHTNALIPISYCGDPGGNRLTASQALLIKTENFFFDFRSMFTALLSSAFS